MQRYNGQGFYKQLYVAFKLAPDLKNVNGGHVSVLTSSMLRTYTSNIDERIIL